MYSLLLAAALLLLPGLALLSLWPREDGWGLGRRLLAAPGAGLAAVALVFQFAWALGLRFDALAAGLLAGGRGRGSRHMGGAGGAETGAAGCGVGRRRGSRRAGVCSSSRCSA